MDKKDVGYIWSIGANVGSGRTLSIQGNFAMGASLDEMNAEVDKALKVTSRQQSIAAIPTLRIEIEKLESIVSGSEGDIKRLDERFAGRKVTEHETMQRKEAISNLDRFKFELDRTRQQLQEALSEAG